MAESIGAVSRAKRARDRAYAEYLERADELALAIEGALSRGVAPAAIRGELGTSREAIRRLLSRSAARRKDAPSGAHGTRIGDTPNPDRPVPELGTSGPDRGTPGSGTTSPGFQKAPCNYSDTEKPFPRGALQLMGHRESPR